MPQAKKCCAGKRKIIDEVEYIKIRVNMINKKSSKETVV